MQDYFRLSAHQLRERVLENNTKASDIASSIISRYDEIEDRIKGFAHFDKKELIQRAANLDESPKGSKTYPLNKIPIVIKDNICVENELTTCASKILKNFRPPYDATVVKKLKEAGALLIGKANMDEFAFGSSCETSCYGPTNNPHDYHRVPGGSSGGSAALVAADETVLALGSDTGGSIRQPAALCGVVGLKPTYGRVSRYGLIAFGSSLDQIGPITKDVTDAATLLNVIAGYDPMDSTSADMPVPDYTELLDGNIRGLKIGVIKNSQDIKSPVLSAEIGFSEIKKSYETALEVLKGLGAEIIDISIPHIEDPHYVISVYYIIACSEASSNLARFDGVKYGFRGSLVSGEQSLIDMCKQTRGTGFGPEARRRIILGTYSLSSGYYDAYYLKAQKVRNLIKKDFDQAFKKCDIIVNPTSPEVAWPKGLKTKSPLLMYLSDLFTIPANLAGIPAISIPCGYNDAGLPIGLQFMARHFDEQTLLRVAHAYENNAGLKRKKV
jgi:aspartyl-tRNA(Asn)/glutamyl-tRNA(Gln) amidotransferase subunit A